MDTAERPAVDILDDRPDFVKKLDEIDVHNLSPEDEKFLYDSVQNFFMENFPVDKELVDKIPEKTVILNHEDYMKEYCRTEPNPRKENPPVGFYDVPLDKNFIDNDAAVNATDLFSTIFHESLHFVSISQGAGFEVKNFKELDDLSFLGDDISEDEIKHYAKKASECVTEGATKLLEHISLEDMGIDTSQDGGYMPHVHIMDKVIHATVESYEQFVNAYFHKNTEDFRKEIELTLLPDDKKAEFENGEIPTGEFTRCLFNIGKALDEMEYFSSEEVNDPDSYNEVYSAVCDATQYYANLKEEKKNA